MTDALKQLELVAKDLFDNFVDETGAEFDVTTCELAKYTAERSAHLATLVGDPDFMKAVAAERNALAITAAIRVVQQADAADARLDALIYGMLAVAARLVVVA